jgi:glycosyltransferase involved in cell wall biosynthesis/LmbE family N-acetylglucosaminyl deacetylase
MLAEEKDLIPFTTSELPKGKWLVFAPHADDETFGMGGSLLLAKQQKIEVTLVVMTDGQSGNSDNQKDICQTRKLEVQQIANYLELENWIWLGEKDRGLGLSDALIAKIKDIIDTEKPEHVFIPSPMELHPDHRMTAEVVCQAMNNLSIKAELYCYEISVQSQINVLIDTSSVIEEKKSLISLYKSQTSQNNYLDVVLALDKARTYTLPAQVSYAEGFTRIEFYNDGALPEYLYKQLLPFWQTTHNGKLPLVTVIIRTKDRPEFLQRAVQSVIDQIYANIELLIINDAGCDVVLDEAAIKHNLTQYQLINLEQNAGRAGAANIGLTEFNGDYALFLDDDDTIDSNHIIQLIRIIQENTADVAYSGVRTDDGKLYNQKYDKYHLYAGNYIPIHSVIFSKKIIQEDCSFDESFTAYEDWDFWLQLSQKTDFCHSDLVTATYYSSGNSGAGINSDPSIDYNFRLKIYNKWGKIWTPEILNNIFLSMHNRFNEKSTRLDVSEDIQEQQKVHIQNHCEHIHRLEQAIEHHRSTEKLNESHIHNLEDHIKQRNKTIDESTAHIKNLEAKIKHLEDVIHFLENNGLFKKTHRTLSKFKHRVVRIFINYPKRIIVHAKKYLQLHPGGISRGFEVLKKEGIKAVFSRLVKIIKGGFAGNTTTVNKQGGIVANIEPVNPPNLYASYQYENPILTPFISQEIERFEYAPLISIIMPVYNVEPKWLQKAIQSVNDQWYKNWELCIVDDASNNQETLAYLQEINNKKIKINYLQKNVNISEASNEALALACGDYIALMDHDDELTPDALYEVIKTINLEKAEFIYSDEDKIHFVGGFCDPHYKADYSPDMILSQNYISHLGVIKKELINQVNGFSAGLDGAQDYDLYLKVLEKTEKISHIAKVLYHWRKIPGSTSSDFGHKSYADESGKQAVINALKRRNIDAQVLNGDFAGTYRVKRTIIDSPLVSIIIPFKDRPDLLTLCIESILNKSSYKNFEIIAVSNGSNEKATFDEMTRLSSLDKRVCFYEYNVKFNYSKINNYAVKNYAQGDYLILLNNDIEIISEDWIEELLSFAQRKEIGAVGAKLFYPDDTIQHAGIILGLGGVAGHSHKYFPKDSLGYFCRLQLIQNLSAVTGACLMVEKAKYNEIGGLNEQQLSIAFNDVDFCLRLREKKYLNIYTPYCMAYHHESVSRGTEDTDKKQQRFKTEIDYMRATHIHELRKDPYYNVNLSLIHEDFSLKKTTDEL